MRSFAKIVALAVAFACPAGASDFRNSSKAASVAVANPGDTIEFTLRVVNDAPSVRPTVADDLPANVTYVPGSTTLGIPGFPFSVAVADKGAQSGLSGTGYELPISIGTDALFGREAQLRLQARVNANAGGTSVCNAGRITAADAPSPASVAAPCVPVRLSSSPPDLTASLKSFANQTRSDGTVRPGDALAFSIQVENAGGVPTSATIVSDKLDPSLAFVSAGQGGGYDAATRTVRWTLQTVEVGKGPLLTFVATVARPLPNGTRIENVALFSAAELPAAGQASNVVAISVTSAPDLSAATKIVTSSTTPVAPLGTLAYAIRIPNSGDMDAANVVVADAVDASLDSVAVLDGGTLSGSTITWRIPRVAAGGVAVVRFNARVKPLTANGTVIANQASITSDEIGTPQPTDDPNTPAAKDATLVTVVSAPDLASSTKSVEIVGQPAPDLARPGDTVRYTLRAVNTGNAAATRVVVTDPVDPQLADIVPEGGGVLAGTTIRWDGATTPALARLLPGDPPVVLTFTARLLPAVKNGDVVTNQAQLTSDEAIQFVTDDPSTPAPRDPTRFTVRFPVLRATKAVAAVAPRADGTIHPNDVVEYTIAIANSGGLAATKLVAFDDLDPQLADIQPGQGGTLSGRRITWTETTTPALARLAAGATATLTFRARVAASTANGAIVTNQGSVTAAELAAPLVTDDPSTATAGDPTRFTVVAQADLRATTKTVRNLSRQTGTYLVGDSVQYTIRVLNGGDAPATDVVVTDAIDTALDVPFSSPVVWDRTVVPQLARLAPGESVELTFSARISGRARDGQVVANQALLRANEIAGQRSDDPSTAAPGDPTLFTVIAGPRLSRSIKSVSNVSSPGQPVRPGDVLEYAIDVLNDGAEPAVNASVTDAAPPLTTYVPGSTRLNGAVVVDVQGHSALETGLRVRSPRVGTPEGNVLPSSGAAPDDTVAHVSFRVRVADDAVAGSAISNQAQLRAEKVPQAATDDPSTPTPGDATVVVVGSAPLLQAHKTWRLSSDLATPGAVDPGDTVEWLVEVANRGTAQATSVAFEDDLPAGAAYVPGSLSVDGRALTDAADGDAGDVTAAAGRSRVRVALGGLPAGGRATIAFRAVAGSVTSISNQGRVSAFGGLGVLTDGDLSLPGEQPTITPVVGTPALDLSASVHAVRDLDGGEVQPTDELLYTVTLVNNGTGDATAAQVEDALPAGLTLVAGSLGGDGALSFNGGVIRATGLVLPARGGRAQVQFRALVLGSLVPGTVITNVARVRAAPGAAPLDLPATVVVGQALGTVGIAGRAWQDVFLDGAFGRFDRPLPGLQILVRRADAAEGPPIKTAVADAQGQYRFADLPPAGYRLEALSAQGAHLADAALVPAAGKLTLGDLRVAAGGLVYRSDDKSAVAGARVFLAYGAGSASFEVPQCERDRAPLAQGRLVDERCLRDGQQGQRTDATGLYRFDLRPSSGAQVRRPYELRVETGSPLLRFPSAALPPEDGTALPGPVVAQGAPQLVERNRWFSRLSLAAGESVDHNHLPLDAGRLTLSKVATRAVAAPGEVVSYVVSVRNGSANDVRVDAAGLGGLRIADALPEGMHYLAGTARAVRLIENAGAARSPQRACARLAEAAQGTSCPGGRADPLRPVAGKAGATAGTFLDFGAYDLRAGETLELRYAAMVSTQARRGDAVNRAVARIGDVDVSNGDSATVRIAQDALFDLASLIGSVRCTSGEPLPFVRIFEDEGYSAETDRTGKFHFHGLQPGLHRFKVDPRTLPPGSEPVDGGALTTYLTRGLDARSSFQVACKHAEVGPTSIKRKELPPPPKPPAPPIAVTGDVNALNATVEGVPLDPPLGDVALVAAPELPDALAVENGKTIAPARFRTLLATGRAPLAWRFVVQSEAGVDLARLSGDGLPPEELTWPAPDFAGPLAQGASLRYRLWLFGPRMSTASPARTLRLVAPPQPPALVEDAVLRGVLFAEGTAEPTAELRRKLAPLAAKLNADASLHARIDVHTAQAATAVKAQALSDDQAGAVRDALAGLGVPSARIQARGKGADEPVAPNINERGRAQNRRVVVQIVKPQATPLEPLAAPKAAPRALVEGAELALDGGKFAAGVERSGGEMELQLDREDGASSFARVEAGKGANPASGTQHVEARPLQHRARIGAADVAVPLFATAISVEAERGSAGLVPLDARGRPRGLSLLVRSRSLDAVSWELAVKTAAGATAWDAKGDGPPPARLAWPETVPLLAGEHVATLVVRDRNGGEATSTARFLAAAPRAPILRRELQADRIFAGRTAVLRADARKLLDDLAAELKGEGALAGPVVLEAFGDDLIDAQRLSEQRAEALLRAVEQRGVQADRVTARGRGAAQPLAPNATARGRRRNNRVAVSLYARPDAAAQAPKGPCAASERLALVDPDQCVLAADLPADGPVELSMHLAGGGTVRARAAAPSVWPGGVEEPDAARTTARSKVVARPDEPAPPLLTQEGARPEPERPPPPAANVRAILPPANALVRADTLWVRGSADPRNKLTIDGRPVPLDANGRFDLRVPVKRGATTLAIVSTDPEGNTATIERPFSVDPDGLFALALLDGAAGQGGAQLEGQGHRTELGPAFLKGRASAYVDGRWDTSSRLGGLFKDVRLSANLDTARTAADASLRDLYDPAKFYPALGDSGDFRQEAQSRGPLWLKLTADDSRLLAGDFKTRLQSQGEQLFRYDRTVTGVELEIARSTSSLFGRAGALDTRVGGFVAQGEARIRHAHAELRGTGGSVFWLRHADVVEGTEQVRLVIRDGRTGVELSRVEQRRDLDYTLRPAEGRLLFKQPVPSTSDASFLTNLNTTTPLGGHPVFVVVDYEYRGRVDEGSGSGGFHVQETLFGVLTAGGGLIHEGHAAGQDYQLAGLNLGVRPKPRTFATIEVARSKGTDAEGYVSADGGMTFGSLGANCIDRAADLYACLAEGRALRFEAGAELADWIAGRSADLLRAHGYFDVRERGFYASGSTADQGTAKGGALLQFTPDKLTKLTLRFDSVASDVALAFDPAAGFATKRVTRRFVGAQVQRAIGDVTLTAELTDVATGDPQLGTTAADVALLGASWKATPKLTLAIAGEAALRADGASYPTTGDRYAATASATWKLSEQLYVQAAETVRFSGENATTIGLRTPLVSLQGGPGSAYLNERFSLRSGELLSTTVLGAEQRLGQHTRTYGEVQLDSAAAGGQQRAVLGLANRFELRPGLFAGFAYERAHVVGPAGAALGGSLAPGVLYPGATPGATLGGINGVAPTASPSLNPVAACIPGTAASGPPVLGGQGTCTPSPQGGLGFNPAGGFYPGTTSRDAISLSLEATGSDRYKASAKGEVRRDKADERLLGLTGVADRLHLVLLGDASAKASDDWGLFGRVHWLESLATDVTKPAATRVEARWLELTAGLAFRPVRDDFLSVLFKATRLYDQRPLSLTSGLQDTQISDVVSVSPTVELPWRFALAEKVAWKHTRAFFDAAIVDTHLWLWVNRLDHHLRPTIDLSGEFRLYALRGPASGGRTVGGDSERGFLVEAAWRPNRWARLGLGYNFTSFSDNELARLDRSSGGFFIRAAGQY